MNDDLQKLGKILAKGFRKAKRWYLAYLTCQLVILIFAVICIFAELNPNLTATVAFLGVLATECIRWRSDVWKSEAEFAKRKWEAADGLGTTSNVKEIADWLAARPKGFLEDVTAAEIQGSQFDSVEPVGPRRVVENTEESAWWSKLESRRMVSYLAIVLVLLVVAGFIGLAVSIAALKLGMVPQSGVIVQNVGGIICSVLAFVFSLNLIRLLAEFFAFSSEAEEILRRCGHLLSQSTLTEREALSVMHDYQTARNSAPLLPTFLWKRHGVHLREQWTQFRRKIKATPPP